MVAPSVGEATVLFFACSFLLVVASGVLAHIQLGLWGVSLAEWLGIFLPIVIWLRARTMVDVGFVAHAPRKRYLLLGAILGGTVWIGLHVLVLLQEQFFPVPKELEADLLKLVASHPLGATVLAVAVTPAICEELLCRGVLLKAFAGRFGARWGVVISAAMFAALHLSPHRLLSTFALGLVLGTLTLRSGSIWPAAVAHFMNNTVVLALARIASE